MYFDNSKFQFVITITFAMIISKESHGVFQFSLIPFNIIRSVLSIKLVRLNPQVSVAIFPARVHQLREPLKLMLED